MKRVLCVLYTPLSWLVFLFGLFSHAQQAKKANKTAKKLKVFCCVLVWLNVTEVLYDTPPPISVGLHLHFPLPLNGVWKRETRRLFCISHTEVHWLSLCKEKELLCFISLHLDWDKGVRPTLEHFLSRANAVWEFLLCVIGSSCHVTSCFFFCDAGKKVLIINR